MTDATGAIPREAEPAQRDARRAWIIGGSLLIAHAVLVLVADGAPGLRFPGSSLVLEAIWAAALLIFAFGIRGAGSVVGRRPSGVVALVVAAALPLVSDAIWWIIPAQALDPLLTVMIGQSLQAVSLAALVVAAVVIARAGSVPHRSRWVPLILIAVGAAPQVLALIVLTATRDPFTQVGIALAMQSISIVGVLTTLALGILAIVLAPREAPRAEAAVQVYPPAS